MSVLKNKKKQEEKKVASAGKEDLVKEPVTELEGKSETDDKKEGNARSGALKAASNRAKGKTATEPAPVDDTGTASNENGSSENEGDASKEGQTALTADGSIVVEEDKKLQEPKSGDSDEGEDDLDEGEDDNGFLNANRTTAMESWTKTLNVVTLVSTDMYTFNIPSIQRKFVWTNYQQSMLVYSAIYNFYIPPIVGHKNADGAIELLDGLQRRTTLHKFRNNELKLHKSTPPIFGIEIGGMHYEDLPKHLQQLFDMKEITLVIHENMTEEEIEQLFTNLNSGTSLTKFHLLRVEASEKTMDFVRKLSEETFVSEYITLSEKQRANSEDEKIIFHTIKLLMEPMSSLTMPDLTKFVKEHLRETGVPTEVQVHLLSGVRLLNDAYEMLEEKYRTNALRKTHVPMVWLMAIRAQRSSDGEVKPADFYAWVKKFFVDDYDKQLAYKNAAMHSANKADNVKKRLEALTSHYDKFMKKAAVSK